MYQHLDSTFNPKSPTLQWVINWNWHFPVLQYWLSVSSLSVFILTSNFAPVSLSFYKKDTCVWLLFIHLPLFNCHLNLYKLSTAPSNITVFNRCPDIYEHYIPVVYHNFHFNQCSTNAFSTTRALMCDTTSYININCVVIYKRG